MVQRAGPRLQLHVDLLAILQLKIWLKQLHCGPLHIGGLLPQPFGNEPPFSAPVVIVELWQRDKQPGWRLSGHRAT